MPNQNEALKSEIEGRAATLRTQPAEHVIHEVLVLNDAIAYTLYPLMCEQNITISQLAKQAGISRAAVVKMLRGGGCKTNQLAEMAYVLGHRIKFKVEKMDAN